MAKFPHHHDYQLVCFIISLSLILSTVIDIADSTDGTSTSNPSCNTNSTQHNTSTAGAFKFGLNLETYLIVGAGGVAVLSLLILFIFIFVTCRKKRASTPSEQIESGNSSRRGCQLSNDYEPNTESRQIREYQALSFDGDTSGAASSTAERNEPQPTAQSKRRQTEGNDDKDVMYSRVKKQKKLQQEEGLPFSNGCQTTADNEEMNSKPETKPRKSLLDELYTKPRKKKRKKPTYMNSNMVEMLLDAGQPSLSNVKEEFDGATHDTQSHKVARL